MKKLLVISVALVTLFALAPRGADAQTNTLIYGNVPSTVTPGQSFTFSVTLNWAPGGGETTLQGISLWLIQLSGPSSPFTLALTNRDASNSFFDTQQSSNSELFGQSGSMANPPRNMPLEPLNDQGPGSPFGPGTGNRTDLGATVGFPADTAGQYFLANFTLSTSLSTAPGTYTISNTTSGNNTIDTGRISITNAMSGGQTFPISQSTFSFTVIPEPSTYALLAFGGVALATVAYRRRVAS